MHLTPDWQDLTKDTTTIGLLETKILPPYLKTCRWFAGKARKLSGIDINQMLSLHAPSKTFHLLILKVKYHTGKSEDYLLPLSLVDSVNKVPAKGIVSQTANGYLIDAIYDEVFRKTIFVHLYHADKVKQQNGALYFEKGSAFREENFSENISSHVLDVDQSNSSIIYDNKYFLKIYRKLFRETNPDVEVVKFLTEKAGFTHIPSFAGTFYWKKASGAPITLGMMQQKVSAIKDAWFLAGDYLNEFLLSLRDGNDIIPESSTRQAEMLGKRTAEMHLALASDTTDAAFIPEHFNEEYTDWLLDNCESLLKRRIRLTKDCYSTLDEGGRQLAKMFLNNHQRIREFFLRVKKIGLRSSRIRIHGDYHLGQILFTGNDYLILDFEGEPESTIKDRKIKHSPLKDVAGMLRSFHYAVSAKLLFSSDTEKLPDEKIDRAVQEWYDAVRKSFLNAYWITMKGSPVFQAEKAELKFLLQYHLLEKTVYELGYELNGRPAWVKIPLKGIEQVLKSLDD